MITHTNQLEERISLTLRKKVPEHKRTVDPLFLKVNCKELA